MNDTNAAQLAQLAAEVAGCTACRLYQGTTNPVPGYGSVTAEIMFIGEAPGANEDKQGLPFVGRSGQYLDYLLNLIDLKREQVFITNVVKHRPPDNRDPQADEIIACKHFLDAQIAIINPLVIVTLGRFSMARYFPNAKITQVHGQPRYADGRAYYPLFHPAAALRNPPLRWDMEADVKRIPELVEEVKRRRSGPVDAGAPVDAPSDDDAPTDPPEQLPLF